ncbi:exopolysaccharide biosynthesis transcriptional activator EpsA [Lachnospiraceae bacterium KM106-2]|nr:exopolysaccharide biosynthesis transcriptional activator EpsA [Lachnospiraceae bacterium KM106-2]
MKIEDIKKHKVGLAFCVLQVLISLVFFIRILMVNVLKPGIMTGIGFALLCLAAITVLLNLYPRVHIIGKTMAILLSVVLVIGIVYVNKTDSTIDQITTAKKKVANVSVIALKKSGLTTINDAEKDHFGIVSAIDKKSTNKAVENLNTKLKKTISTKGYQDYVSLAKGLYDGEVKTIILNEAYRNVIKGKYKDFDKQTVVLNKYKSETEINLGKVTKNLTDEPFLVFLTGIDTSGKVDKVMRSDVNMVATVNPKTKQILLTSVPRDYYLETSVSNGEKDKLTHTGQYGVDCSVETLEKLFDVDINYYFRVNFSGFKDIINALGGVTVHSDYTFKADWGPSFKKGDNKVNGKQALAFARQRHEFYKGKKTGLQGGDFQRIKDQQYLVKAIIEKATSPKILTNFIGIMDSVSKSFETNINSSDIKGLLKMQIDEMPEWNIVMTSLDGKCGMEYTFTHSIPRVKYSVVYVRESQVEASNKMIGRVLDGKKIKKSDFDDLVQEYIDKH